MTSPPQTEPIASRPRYATLAPRPCAGALMICDAAGSDALLALIAAAPDLAAKARVIRLKNAPCPPLEGLAVTEIASAAALDSMIDVALAGATMGLQAFLAGSEGLIGQAQARLLVHGLPLGAIQAEHRGSMARRMQCVHCKTIAEEVTVDPYRCPGCGRALFVRDHFSRRLGAFQGVCIDAETPGEVPPAVEIR